MVSRGISPDNIGIPSGVVIALPAYNEEQALGALLDRIRAVSLLQGVSKRVLVVNDGSKDATHEIAENHPLASDGKLQVVDHPCNLGLAAAMRTAIEQFLKDAGPRDVLVTMDADDTHDPAQISLLLDCLEDREDIVIASRFRPGARVYGVSIPRRVLSYGLYPFMRLLAPVPGVRDYSCGFRAYRAGILRLAVKSYGDDLIQTTGFSVQSELLIKCAANGAKVGEVPLILHYDRKVGKSKMRFCNTLAGYLRLIAIRRKVFRGAAD